MNRQKLVLAALLAILGLAVWYAYWASPRQERVARATGSAAKVKPTRDVSPELTPTDKRRVRLEILERGMDAFSEPTRDIFRLTPPRPTAAAPKPVVTTPQPVPPTPVFPPIQMPSPAALQGSSVRFNVLGFLKKENQQKTVFLALDNDIFIVKEGDRFGKNKEFEAEEITDEKLVVRQGDGNFPITVPLGDKKAPPPISSSPMALPPMPPNAGRFPGSVRPTSFRPPPIQIEYDEEEEDEDEEDFEEDEDFEDDFEDSEEEDLSTDNEQPTDEIESTNPDAGSNGSLQLRSMI